MKGVLAVLVVVLVGLGVWLLFMQPSEPEANTPSLSENIPKETLKAVESDTDSPFSKSQLSDDIQETRNDAEQLAEAKAQLDDLILEYNDNLTDPASRAETQVEIEKLLKQYNELVLPVALAKINEK